MRWTKKQLFCIFLKMPKSLMFAVLALLAINLLSFFVFPSIDTYAVADEVYTIDSSTSSIQYPCWNATSDHTCSPYSYMIIEYSGSGTLDSIFIPFYLKGSPSTYRDFLYPASYTVVDISDISSSILPRIYVSSHPNVNISSGASFTVTFSENNPFASGITPSGSLSITENGTYDVTNYAEAVVDVPQGGGGGQNYHDDLTSINNSILICGAVVLVIYFFYCIYRMFTKSIGGFK